ncbi:MAG: dephospho-CoA kinase [Ignavibacteria bacterium]|jgi:dephospho-CoA kinase
MKLKIAITGNIGSGKSTVAAFIEEKGYRVIKADDISKEFYVADENVKRKIIDNFGVKSYIDGKLNKSYLAEKVFSNEENLKRINSILHPPTIKKINLLMKKALQKCEMVFTEAALIYEAKMEQYYDYVIVVAADKEIRKERLSKRDGSYKDDFEKRDSKQIPQEEKVKLASFVVVNNSSLKILRSKIDFIINLIKQIN